jgi:hypothetical protein
MLLASEALTQIQAEAWQEGYKARDLDELVIPHGFETANPYRLTNTEQLQQHDQPDANV